MYSAISFPLSSKGKSPHGEIGKHKGLKILAFNYVLSSSLSEGTNRWKVAVNKKQFVYDNVYDMTYCIRHEEKKDSSSEINSTNSRLKIFALLGVSVRVWPRVPLDEKKFLFIF